MSLWNRRGFVLQVNICLAMPRTRRRIKATRQEQGEDNCLEALRKTTARLATSVAGWYLSQHARGGHENVWPVVASHEKVSPKTSIWTQSI